MKFIEFEKMMRHSKLVTEINSIISKFNEQERTLDIDNPFIELYATLDKLSNEAKKELIYLVKYGFLAVRLSIIYGRYKPENVHYEMTIHLKQESPSFTVIRDRTCLLLSPKMFTEMLTIFSNYKLDFLLTSENINHEDIHLEDDNDFKIFNEYKDIEFDMEDLEDEDEEDNSF